MQVSADASRPRDGTTTRRDRTRLECHAVLNARAPIVGYDPRQAALPRVSVPAIGSGELCVPYSTLMVGSMSDAPYSDRESGKLPFSLFRSLIDHAAPPERATAVRR